MKNFIYKNVTAVLVTWWLFIFVLCATPGHLIPSTHWLELLSFDKWVHAGIFFILTSLFFVLKIKKQEATYWLILYILICVLYGASLEWMQANLFSERSSDWQDILANSSGCLLALLFYKNLKTQFLKKPV